jgi:hypothetical protein
MNPVLILLLVTLVLTPAAFAQSAAKGPTGLSDDPGYFPLAVWLQAPRNATKYKDIGVNLYVGLHKGPTEEQLAELDKAAMPVICHQNEVGLNWKNPKTIVGWMHGDEPDNAQPKPAGQEGWDPPIPPAKIVADYDAIRKTDPTRPVFLNLGWGVAWDNWHGRGVRSRHPEDYPEYARGADIVSFDIYPAVTGGGERYKEVTGKLELVPFGVERLRKWTDNKKPVWTCIETTRISNPDATLTPHQVRAEVWMAIIHGARGIVYFAHEFKPKFVEAGLLANAEIAKEVKAINARVTELAPVINSPAVDNPTVESSDKDVPIAVMTRRHNGSTYVFAVSMRDRPVSGSFKLPGVAGKVEVIGEGRRLDVAAGGWSDEFKGYDVHLYRLGQ